MTKNIEYMTRFSSCVINALLLISGLLAAGIAATIIFASLGTATVTFLSYGLSRLLSMAIDGVPHSVDWWRLLPFPA